MASLTKQAVIDLKLKGFNAAEKRLNNLNRKLRELQDRARAGIRIGPFGGGGGGGGPGGVMRGIDRTLFPPLIGGGGGMGPGGGAGRGGRGGRGGAGGGMAAAAAGALGGRFGDSHEVTLGFAGLQGFHFSGLRQTVTDTLDAAAAARATEGAFINLSHAIGQNYAVALSTARQHSQGMVSDTELMQGMLRLQATGVDLSAEQFGVLTNQIIRMASVTGVTAADAMDRLAKGISKVEVDLLDELLIYPRLQGAVQEYARSTGKAVEEVTKQEKITLFLQQAQEQAAAATAKMGTEQEALFKKLNQTRAALKNMQDSVAKVSPSLLAGGTAAVSAGSNMFTTMFGFESMTAFKGGGGFRAVFGRLLGVGGRALAASLLGGGVAGLVATLAAAFGPSIMSAIANLVGGAFGGSATTAGSVSMAAAATTPGVGAGTANLFKAAPAQTNSFFIQTTLADGAIERTAGDASRQIARALRNDVHRVNARTEAGMRGEFYDITAVPLGF